MKAHEIETGNPISEETLAAEGIHYRALPLVKPIYQAELEALKQDKGYIEQDVIELVPETPGLEEICQKYDAEHLHEEDEVRFILEGAGIFDIRAEDGRWMRVEVERGDLIVVPAKRYHRFELTDVKTIRCVRLFKDRSGWVPHYRAS